jgi:hypothetical protein
LFDQFITCVEQVIGCVTGPFCNGDFLVDVGDLCSQ